jgi:hypothetical protein
MMFEFPIKDMHCRRASPGMGNASTMDERLIPAEHRVGNLYPMSPETNYTNSIELCRQGAAILARETAASPEGRGSFLLKSLRINVHRCRSVVHFPVPYRSSDGFFMDGRGDA